MKNTGKYFSSLILVIGLLFCVGLRTAQAGPVLKFGEESSLAINYEMNLYGQWRDTGSGPDKQNSTTDMYFRRNRIIFNGQVNSKYGFYIDFEHKGNRRIENLEVSDSASSSLYMLDAFVKADFTDAFRFRVGLVKDPLVREHNEGCFFPLSVDRSLFVYTPLPDVSRDYGFLFWGNLFDAKVQYKASAMKGNDSGDDPQSSLRYTGRVHLTLLDPESAIVYRGTYLGNKKILTLGGGYQYEPKALYGNLLAKTLAKDYTAWTVDGFFEYPTEAVGTFTLSGAYLVIDFDKAYQGGDPDTRSTGLNGEKKGWYTKAAYLLPMEVGPGQLQVYGRYEDWRFSQLQTIDNQRILWTAGGINYYINGQDLRITLEYSNTSYDKKYAGAAVLKDFSTVTTMLQMLF